MKNHFPIIFLLILFSVAPLSAREEASERSGNYRELMLAVISTQGVVTGYYENGTGWDSKSQQPRFTCIFYLLGKKAGDKYLIQTWFPADQDPKEVITGELKFLPKETGGLGPSVHVRLHREHGGCWNVNPQLAKPEGDDLVLENLTDWVEVRVVKAAKAFFHDAPGSKPRKAYVVRGNGLGVFEKKPGWVRVDFQGKTKGWVKESELFSPDPPK